MADRELEELIRSIRALPVPATVTELRTRHIIAANDSAAAMLGAPADELVGTDVMVRIRPDQREAAHKAFEAMADKVVDGYEAHRTFVSTTGQEATVAAWGRRIEGPGWAVATWMLLPTGRTGAALETLVVGSPQIVLALTDHDWQLDYVSADADMLVAPGSARRGFPLLGLVHPSAASEFLAAAARAVADRVTVTLLTRIHAGPNEWAARYCLIVPMCEHEPPRLGVLLTDASSSETSETAQSHVHRDLTQTALEARASQALSALLPLARLKGGHELSARQIEIVSRLVAGERISDIASAMYLSPSTVRNHLTAVYRKFAVHSQAELLAALLRESSSGN